MQGPDGTRVSTPPPSTSTPADTSSSSSSSSAADISKGVWSQQEHDLFLEALQLHPNGPWKAVSDRVGTRSVRQVQTHAQKYHEKVARRLRGLRKERKRVQRQEHRIDDEMMEICNDLQNDNALLPPKPAGKRRRKRQPQQEEDTPKEKKAVEAKAGQEDASRIDDGEETKLTESMRDVHVADAPVSPYRTTEPSDVTNQSHEETQELSFYECIDYLIEALSPNDSEYESN